MPKISQCEKCAHFLLRNVSQEKDTLDIIATSIFGVHDIFPITAIEICRLTNAPIEYNGMQCAYCDMLNDFETMIGKDNIIQIF